MSLSGTLDCRAVGLALLTLATFARLAGAGATSQGTSGAAAASPLIVSVAPDGDPIKPFPSDGDLWLNTWADDDALYSGWGDGHGVAARLDRTDCGIARFSGTLPQITAQERCFGAPTAQPDVNDKPSSLLFLGGRLYGQFHSPLGNAWIGYLAYSDDHGATWTRVGFYQSGEPKPLNASPWTQDVNSPFRCLFFINMGKNFALNTDGYVYALGIGQEWAWFGGVYLARVKKEDILHYDGYQYLTGLDNGMPRWSAAQADAIPLADIKATGQGSAMFHSGINRYLFLTAQALYDAPEPWGPWTLAGVWDGADAPVQWQGGYQPGIISKNTDHTSFWFTIAGQNLPPEITYCLHLGKMVMQLRTGETVSTPAIPTGPGTGATGSSCGFSAGGATSSAGHWVEYQFDWSGDGTVVSPWGGQIRANTWTVPGTYGVRARARCTTDTAAMSAWSRGLVVTISGPAPRVRRYLHRPSGHP